MCKLSENCQRKKEYCASSSTGKRKNGGVFVPCNLDKDHPIFFAIDKVDLKIDTPDRKRQPHETGTAVSQHKSVKQELCEASNQN